MTDTLQPPDISTVNAPTSAPTPAPVPPPPSVSAGAGQPPATGAPPDFGKGVVAPTPQASATQPEQESHFSKVAHNIFQALAGGPQRTLDENGNWQEKPLTKGGIARGVIAGALAGMFAGAQRGPGKYPGGPVEALGRGGVAGMALTQQQREQQMQNQAIQQQAQLRKAQIWEINQRGILNEANLTKQNLENNKNYMLLNQMAASQLDVVPTNFDSQSAHSEAELQEGLKSGKFLPGSHLGMKVGEDENGGLYRVVTDPNAKVTLTPEMYNMAASINPVQFPLIHKDGSNLSDAEKTQTMTVQDYLHTMNRGVAGFDIPNQYLGVIKNILTDAKDDLADKVPDKIDPKYMGAWLQAQRALAYAHMTGKGPTAILDNLDAVNPMTGLPAVPETVKNQIYASVGGGDVALGHQLLQAEQIDIAAKAKGKQAAAERQAQIENPKTAEEIEARLSQLDPNDPNTDTEYNKLVNLRDQMITDAATKSGKIAKERALQGGSDYDSIMKYGYGKISHKTLALENSPTTVAAPDTFLMNTQAGTPVPSSKENTFKPSQADRNRSSFAKSAISTINNMQSIVSDAAAHYGPIQGPVRSFLIAHGVDPSKWDAELQAYQKLAKSAATGAHVGGRFNIPNLDEMDSIMGSSSMNYAQFQALDAVKNVMSEYTRNGGLITVGMWKRMTPNQQAVYMGQTPTPPAGWQGHLHENASTPVTINGKTEYWTLERGRPKLLL